jgi:hypothetical protein
LQPVATEKPDLERLIVEYLLTGFQAMIVQARVFSDPEYCARQDADKLAIAHGVLGDKLAGVAATAAALGILTAPLPDTDGNTLELPGLDAAGPPETSDG